MGNIGTSRSAKTTVRLYEIPSSQTSFHTLTYYSQVNEDEDILGRFSPEVYTWTTPAKGLMQWGLVILSFFGICGTVYAVYPDKPAVPRTFPYDGLREALGGEGAVAVSPCSHLLVFDNNYVDFLPLQAMPEQE